VIVLVMKPDRGSRRRVWRKEVVRVETNLVGERGAAVADRVAVRDLLDQEADFSLSYK
jgi:hypothetical protein